jgi:hypothetical protein
MDIFKIRLNKALSSNRIGKLEAFLLKEGKRNKDKIRKYADYILKNCSDYNWIASYLIVYDGDELSYFLWHLLSLDIFYYLFFFL